MVRKCEGQQDKEGDQKSWSVANEKGQKFQMKCGWKKAYLRRTARIGGILGLLAGLCWRVSAGLRHMTEDSRELTAPPPGRWPGGGGPGGGAPPYD